ncbi:N-acetylneuraminate lyase-like [Asterias rubens]|uniref:N-acetylneuraminate lyase-like n=1 Tax=Asterias rubens TaxID=7604 RepID=UPI001454F6A2|nr:N-acetylneuraminate lyase-like [Asterias rubens]
MNSSIASFKVKGLTAAVFTPFKEDGNLNLGVIDAYADQLLADGVRNIFPCGTTGEGACLTVEERKQVAEKWIKVGKNKFDIIMVHVGTDSIKSTQQLAAHASEIGADAICVVAPVYFKPQSVELLLQYLCEVSKSAPTLPLYYYHNPGQTGINFTLEAIWTGLQTTPVPTLRGVKFTNSNFYDMSRVMLLAGDRLQILYSTDEQLPIALGMGIEGFVGSTYNYAGRGANRIIEAHKAGDFKTLKKEYEMYLSFIPVLIKYGGNVGVNKCLMKVAKCQDIGPARLPNPNLSSETLLLMEQDLKKIGFLKWIKQ